MREEGKTIIQVTHSEKMVSYGSCIINLNGDSENPYEDDEVVRNT